MAIPARDAAQLQVNLLRSHAVGSGAPLSDEVVRGMMFLLDRLALTLCELASFSERRTFALLSPSFLTPRPGALARVCEYVPRLEEDRSLGGEIGGPAVALRTRELVLA